MKLVRQLQYRLLRYPVRITVLIALSTPALFGEIAAFPISIRLLEGPTTVTQNPDKPGEGGCVLSTGIGFAYQVHPRLVFSTDIESMERREVSVHLRYTPITMMMRYTANSHFEHYGFFVMGGYGIGPVTQYESYFRLSGNIAPRSDGELTYASERRWKSGIVLGIGGSLRIEPTVLLLGTLQYRHLSYRTIALTPPNTPPPPDLLSTTLHGGLEARFIVELQL